MNRKHPWVLRKYCPASFNPKRGFSTIRLGTLESFRTIEAGDEIRDEDEGISSLSIGQLALDECHPATIRELKPFCNFGSSNWSEVTLVGGRFTSRMSNPYVWCCSRFEDEVEDRDFGRRLDPAYDSSFLVGDYRRACEWIAGELRKQCTIDHLKESEQKLLRNRGETSLNRCVIDGWCYAVRYVESKHLAVVDGKIAGHGAVFPPNIPEEVHCGLMKQMRFAWQNEYRFMFCFVHPEIGSLCMKPNPIDVYVRGWLCA